ncbi:MAG: two pore domain potassium channel family protein [Propionivibrio sp.]|uniref:ion channel n=1 Tax=Propionivibrio sp. TaxID=2212460 RepID=UPI001A38DB33|nr:ion channel [Propionivibrio sp.]MBL8414723.1 two pore domain potassium channel family protein [Propionivibrio sp.]
MLFVLFACALLLVGTTLLHYEVLRVLNTGLPALGIPNRSKLLVVILVTFLAHATEMAMYGGALYLLVTWLGVGNLSGTTGFSLTTYMYFSAETYTSLGFGDLTPTGPVRLLAGIEALNGLLLIGWSASFTYISMERFWVINSPSEEKSDRP